MRLLREYFFKIGEFAEICGVKKATLIHYAKIGLLLPHHIGENGYYYYHAGQIYDFEVIALLRGMSVPLGEIKEYMENISIDDCQVILRRRLNELKEQRRYLAQVEAIVERTLTEIDEVKKQTLGKIEEITFEEDDYYYVYKMPHRTERAAYELKDSRSLIQHCKEGFINKSINVTEVVLKENVLNGSFAKTYGGFRTDSKEGDNIFARPAGTYLTLADYAGGEGIVHVYRRIKAYADENGYEVCGNAYEEDLLSHIVERDRNNYLVRCYIQVRPRKDLLETCPSDGK